MKVLVPYNKAKEAIAHVIRIDQAVLKKLEAETIADYAYRVKDPDLVADSVTSKEYAIRILGQLMERDRAAGKLAKGTRGSLEGKKPGTGKGRGRAKAITGELRPNLPVMKSLREQGVDQNLAHLARKTAKLTEDKFEQHVEKVVTRAVKAVIQSRQTKRVQSYTGEKEWYTPRQYLDAAVEVMGSIDLDPASSPRAQKHVKASKFYTAEQDGLSKEWSGSVFLNPPYAMPYVRDFAEKIVEQYQAGNIKTGILLTNNATDTEWWRAAARTCSALCFTKRIHFLEGENLEERKSPTNGQTFLYFGKSPKRFADIFSQFGLVLYGFSALWQETHSPTLELELAAE